MNLNKDSSELFYLVQYIALRIFKMSTHGRTILQGARK